MKRFIMIILCLSLFIPFVVSAQTEEKEEENKETTNLITNAKSGILLDYDSGTVIFEKKADTKLSIASLTKMTAQIIILENIEQGKIKWDDIITVSENAASFGGSQIYLEPNEKMSVEDLFKGISVASANDATVAMAEAIAGSEEEFVKLMNKKAKEIGMKNTTFINAHGLDDDTSGNLSTAYDMALLSSYANQYDLYREIVGTKKYTTKTDVKSYVWYNRNKLLSKYEFATGGKNGYTPKAGRTLVTSATKDELSLTTVTLNDDYEYDTHIALYEYAFENYKNYKFIDCNDFDIKTDIKEDQIYVKESFSYPMTEEEYKNSKVVLTLDTNQKYKDNEKIGTVKVLLYDDVLYSEDVYVKIQENRNLFEKIIDWFKRIF